MARAVPDPQVDVCGVDAIGRSVFSLRMGDRPRSGSDRGWMVVHRGKLPVAIHCSLALGSWELGLVPAGHRADRANAVIRNVVIRNAEIRNAEIRNAVIRNVVIRNVVIRNVVIRNAVIRNDDDLHLADGPTAAHR
jgi:hypothetical protein